MTFVENLANWARPRRRAILSGASPVILVWVLFGVVTQLWILVAFAFLGMLFGAGLTAVFVGRPELWNDEARRWRFLAWFVGIGTLVVVAVVAVVFSVT